MQTTHAPNGQLEAANPFLVDLEQLAAMASEPIIKRGVAYFKEHRVMHLDWDPTHIWAHVEGSLPGVPYAVEIGIDGDGELAIHCDCPFEWEPVCKHAVAALLAYGANQPVTHLEVNSASDQAIEDRARRGRGEVTVRHLSGDPWFGTWSAASITASSISSRHYRVQIRSTTERINFCTCPDFASNRLGTCKHIEAVLFQLRKRKLDGTRKRTPGSSSRPVLPSGAPIPIIYLAWDVPDAPQIRLQRPPRLEASLAALLDAHFDPAGALRGALPDALFRLRDQLGDREDVQLGEDAISHAQRVAGDLAHAVKAQRIKDEIIRSGGQLTGVRARLYPYQVEGVAFLASNGRALLADDMGLGKTLQSIAAASWMMHHSDVRQTLIICPASLKHQWAREIQRFTGLEVQVIQGGPAARGVQYRRRAPFTVVNYERAMRDTQVIQETLTPDLLILDEAQRLKNWRTKIAGTIKGIETRYAFVLSGTPLENRLEDLYSLLQIVDPRVLGPLWRYMLEFHVTDERGKVLGYRNLSELRRRVAPVMLRRDRSLVRDQLPDRIQLRLDVPLSPKQQDLHDGAMSAAATLGEIAKRRPLTPSEEHKLLSALQQARMACDAAGLVDKETEGSPKLDELSRLLEELCVEGGRKVVVFSAWERMTAMAEQVARKLELGTVRLHGGVPTQARGALIDRFLEDPGTQVFLSTDAGGVGLNLQAASVLINLDMPWNPAVLEQRIARVHRLGQREPVQVILMVAVDAYEERVAQLIGTKRELFDNVVDPEATGDVVGVSKRMLDLLAETLEPPKAEPYRDAEPELTMEGAPGEDGATEPEAGRGTEPGRDANGREASDRDANGREASGRGPGAEVDAAPADHEMEAIAAEGATLEATSAPEETSGAASTGYRDDTAERLEEDSAVQTAIVKVQQALGTRIERILAASGGLMVVVDAVDDRAEAAADACSNGIPVAVIDARSLAQLRRLGSGSPLAGAVEMAPRPAGVAAEPPLVGLVKKKLRAAEVLIEQGCPEDGIGLLAWAMLASAAHRAGRLEVPAKQEAPVWLYGEALPRGLLTHEDAGAIVRAMALAEAPSIPEPLLYDVLADARRLTSVAVVG